MENIKMTRAIVLTLVLLLALLYSTPSAALVKKTATKVQIDKATAAIAAVEKYVKNTYFNIANAQKQLDLAAREVLKVKSLGKTYLKNYTALAKRVDSVKKKINDRKQLMKNSYLPLEYLPLTYLPDEARLNGDVVGVHGKCFNVGKLDEFINSQSEEQNIRKKLVRIVAYTDEGDAIIFDLTSDGSEIKMIVDATRDKFSSHENRKKKEYTVKEFVKQHHNGGLVYYAITDEGEEFPLIWIGE